MKKITAVIVTLCMLFMEAGVYSHAETVQRNSINMTITFKNDEISNDVKSFITEKGGKVIAEIPELGAIQINASIELIPLLVNRSEIEYIGPSVKLHLPSVKTAVYKKIVKTNADGSEEDMFPDLYSLQWDVKRVTNNGASYSFEKGNHNVVIGIVDSGVDSNHPDLQENLLGGKNYVPKYDGGILQSDATEQGNPEDYMDRNGHGSHVAGTIAGKGAMLGVAPGIGYRAYRVFGESGEAETTTICNGIIGAVNDGVDVISLSLGGYEVNGQLVWNDPATGQKVNLGNELSDNALYKKAIKYAVKHGVTVVVAAGNEAINITEKGKIRDFINSQLEAEGFSYTGAGFELPSAIPGVIVASAVGPNDKFASYSNYGPGAINITAPGGDYTRIDSSPLWYLDMCLSAYNDGSYMWMAGTSMAVPKVSAVAGLLISKYGKMEPQKVADMMYKNAIDLGQTGMDKYFGHGLVQAPSLSIPVSLPEDVEWQERIGGVAREYESTGIQSSDGGYVSIGATESYASGDVNDTDVYIIKTDANGKIEWTNAFGGIEKDFGDAIIETKDGGFLATGYTESFGPGQANVYLIKLDKNGKTEWEKTIGETDTTTGAISICEASDGGYVLTGNKKIKDGDNDIYALKIDEEGNKIWDATFGGEHDDTASTIKQTKDGGYIIAGQSYSTVEMGKRLDLALVKIDKDGNQEWLKLYGSEKSESANDIVEMDDGGYIVAARSVMYYWDPASTYMIRTTNSGEIVWEKEITNNNQTFELHSLERTSDGNFIAAGNKAATSGYNGIYIMKFDSDGKILKERLFDDDYDSCALSIKATKDGGYIIFGLSHKDYLEDYSTDVFIVKVDSNIIK